MSLTQCTLGPTLAPLLAQLLYGGRLRRLRVVDCALPPSPDLCEALRASPLTHLALRRTGLFRDAESVAAAVGALTRHPTLTRIDVSRNACPSSHRALGAALAQLVAANAPPLVELAVSGCGLDEESRHPGRRCARGQPLPARPGVRRVEQHAGAGRRLKGVRTMHAVFDEMKKHTPNRLQMQVQKNA